MKTPPSVLPPAPATPAVNRRRVLSILGGAPLLMACERATPQSCAPPQQIEQTAQLRKRLGYVESPPQTVRTCQTCCYFVEPEDESSCGTCTTLPGPIHPLATCKIFRQKAGV